MPANSCATEAPCATKSRGAGLELRRCSLPSKAERNAARASAFRLACLPSLVNAKPQLLQRWHV